MRLIHTHLRSEALTQDDLTDLSLLRFDCVIAIDPGSISHVPGCVAVLNDKKHKVILLIRNIPSGNINASSIGVFGFFGQITFEVKN